METLAGNHLAIKVQFEIGHTSRLRSKKTPEGFTHDWEIYVQGVNKADISAFVEKVVFVLHESFPRPKRVIKDPPYVLQESGYAGFMLPIEIHFRNKEEPKRFQFSYDLDLQQIGPPHHRSEVKNFIFQHPSEEYKKKLFQGGGVVVSAIVGNSLQGPPQQIISNVNLPDITGSSSHLAESSSGGMVSKPKMSSSDSKKHKSSRTDESNTNSFANLFGTSQNKISKQSPDTKSGSGNVRSSNSNSITQLQHGSGTNSNNASNKDRDKSGRDKDKSSSNSAITDKSRTEKKSERQKSSPHKEARGESKKSHDSKQRSDDSKKDKKDKVRDKERGRDRDRGEKRALSPKAARETIGISPKRLSPQPRPSSSASGQLEEIKRKHSENSARSSSKDKLKSSSSSSKKPKKDKKDRDREKRDDKSQQSNVNSGSHTVGVELRDNNTPYIPTEVKSSSSNNNNNQSTNVVKKVDLKELKGHETIKSKSLSINDNNKLEEKNLNASNSAITAVTTNNNDRNDNKKEKRVHKHKKKSKTKDKEKESGKDKDGERERDRDREKDKIKEKGKDRDKEKEKPKDTKESLEVVKSLNNKSPITKILTTTATTTTATGTKSESHKKSYSKEKKIKDKVISSATKLDDMKVNNNKKKDILLPTSTLSSVKNHAHNNNNLDLSDTGDSVLSVADLNCGLTKKLPLSGNQLSDESSNSSFPDLPPKIITSKTSKNSPAQRDVAKTTPTKNQHKKIEKDDSSKKRRRPNSSTPSATNTNITATNDVLSPEHAFVEPPTKQMKREPGKSPAGNSPANNSNTTPTRVAIGMNNNDIVMSSPATTATTAVAAAAALPQPATTPMDTTPYATNSNDYKAKDYMSELQELHNKIMTLQDNEELQRVVELIATTGCYEITSKTFDFDLCKLDRNTVQRLQEHFAASAVS